MKYEDEFFSNDDAASVWERYCGFLDLTVEEFRHIQDSLLSEQLEKVFCNPEFRLLMGEQDIQNIDDFRNSVKLKNYTDYEPYFRDDNSAIASPDTAYWVHTSATRGTFKRMPYTQRFHGVQVRNVLAALILSSARKSGDVSISPGCSIMNLLPGKPFVSASIAKGIVERFTFKPIPSLSVNEQSGFNKKLDAAIFGGLKSDVDYVIGMTSSLLKVGPRFRKVWNKERKKLPIFFKLSPFVVWRLFKSGFRKNIYPKSAWKVKGVVCWGVDSDILEATVKEQWGREPIQLFGSTEGGIMAIQDWQKGPMAYLPDCVYFEFIPEEYVHSANPPTVLIDEVEDGKAYEMVLTNFYGMPLIRYRQGDMVRISRDANTNRVPRFTFMGRADDTIDAFGIARLNTAAITDALLKADLAPKDWFVIKDFVDGKVLLKFYLESNHVTNPQDIEKQINQSLKSTDRHWAEAVYTMAYNPIRVKLVPSGTFQKAKEQYLLPWPPAVNPPQAFIDLIEGSVKLTS